MAAKRPNPVSKALAVLFSSLIAPVIVNVTANAIKVDVNPPAAAAARPAAIGGEPPVPVVKLLPPATVTPAADPPPARFAWLPASR